MTLSNKSNVNLPPKLLPPCQNYSRSRNGLLCSEEWLSVNEESILHLWESLRSYLNHTNTTILDKCTYVDFNDFVAKYSTHYNDYS